MGPPPPLSLSLTHGLFLACLPGVGVFVSFDRGLRILYFLLNLEILFVNLRKLNFVSDAIEHINIVCTESAVMTDDTHCIYIHGSRWWRSG